MENLIDTCIIKGEKKVRLFSDIYLYENLFCKIIKKHNNSTDAFSIEYRSHNICSRFIGDYMPTIIDYDINKNAILFNKLTFTEFTTLVHDKDYTNAYLCIKNSIILLSMLHKNSFDIKSNKVLNVDGFEIRNIGYTKHKVYFFDPHNVYYGNLELDLARLIISIFMINWKFSVHPFNFFNIISFKEIIFFYESNFRSVDLEQLHKDLFLIYNERKSSILSKINFNVLKYIYTIIYFHYLKIKINELFE